MDQIQHERKEIRTTEDGINVLSLFDGISTGRLALQRAGIKVNRYISSEIDEVAMGISRYNWNDVEYIGDVKQIDIDSLPKIDLLIGGSPCQGFSRNGKGLNFTDKRSALFFEFVKIKRALQKKNKELFFLLENVQMKEEWKDAISEYMMTEPQEVDSSIVAAQKRKRLYWQNICRGIEIEERNVKLSSILEHTETKTIEKGGILFDTEIPSRSIELVTVENGEVRVKQATKKGYITARDGDGVNLSFPTSKTRRGRVTQQKSPTLDCQCEVCVLDCGVIRYFTIKELERLQTLPDDYTKYAILHSEERKELGKAARKKAIGNGWTTEVIVEFMKRLPYRNNPKRMIEAKEDTAR